MVEALLSDLRVFLDGVASLSLVLLHLVQSWPEDRCEAMFSLRQIGVGNSTSLESALLASANCTPPTYSVLYRFFAHVVAPFQSRYIAYSPVCSACLHASLPHSSQVSETGTFIGRRTFRICIWMILSVFRDILWVFAVA